MITIMTKLGKIEAYKQEILGTKVKPNIPITQVTPMQRLPRCPTENNGS